MQCMKPPSRKHAWFNLSSVLTIFAAIQQFFVHTHTHTHTAFCTGDPHLTNLDGAKFTFNGWGEYNYSTGVNYWHTTFWIKVRMQPLPESTTKATELVVSLSLWAGTLPLKWVREKNCLLPSHGETTLLTVPIISYNYGILSFSELVIMHNNWLNTHLSRFQVQI